MKSAKILIKIVTLFLLFFFIEGCKQKPDNLKKSENGKIPVTTSELKKTEVRNTIAASGQFTTDDETILSFKTGGIVRSIFVKEGNRIHAGQLLASLDLNEIEAQVTQAKIGYEKALRDYNRASNLFKDSVATLSQMQDAKSALDVAQQTVTIANYNRKYSEIYAISDGYVLNKFANEGQMVGPGTPVFQTNGAGKGNWMLRVSVSDKEWSKIRAGDAARIVVDTKSGNTYEGEVAKKSEGADPTSGTFSVDIKFKTRVDIDVASGLFGKAMITPSEKLEVWQIPFESFLDGDGSTAYVFTTNDLKTAQKTKVKVSGFNKEGVNVVDGLRSAKYLIISGSAYLKDGSEIDATEKK